jgi:hypothetical protein
MLPEAISEVLGVSLSEVHDLYFGNLDEVRRGCIIEEAVNRRQEDLQERDQFEEDSQRECEATLRSNYEDDTY